MGSRRTDGCKGVKEDRPSRPSCFLGAGRGNPLGPGRVWDYPTLPRSFFPLTAWEVSSHQQADSGNIYSTGRLSAHTLGRVVTAQGHCGQGGDLTFVMILSRSQGGTVRAGKMHTTPPPHSPYLNSFGERKSTNSAAPLPPPFDVTSDKARAGATQICIYLHTQLLTAAFGFGP